MKFTVKEIAEKCSIDDDAARALVKFLSLTSNPPLARCRGRRPVARGAGLGPMVYEIAATAPSAVADLLKRLL